MIKTYLLAFTCCCLLLSCSTQKKFTENTEEDISSLGDQVSFFSFDPSSTDLYVRTVVKILNTKKVVRYQKPTDRDRRYYQLANLEPYMNVDDSIIKIIEEQYLLIDKKRDMVLFINNIPNYTEKLFSKDVNKLAPANAAVKSIGSYDSLGYDIWKFNQFRFGKIEFNSTDSAGYIFRDVLDGKTNHVWYVKKELDGDEIFLKRFSEKDSYTENIREIRPTYPFDMKFRKIADYKFILKDNRRGFRRASHLSEIISDEMQLYRHDKKWHLVFKLASPPPGMNPYIVFENGTVYAAPYFNK